MGTRSFGVNIMSKKLLIVLGVIGLVAYYLYSKGKLTGLVNIANGTMPATMTATPSPVQQATNNAAGGVITSLGTSLSNSISSWFGGSGTTPNAPT